MLTGDDLLAAVQKLPSMTEQEELLKKYQEELEKCFDLAQQLDALNPDLAGTFTGTPSERIERQLYALGVLK
jgi:Asp-tRNA(Asn)/Glu-tRNA(Gln) amidotransferase C subunit